MISKKNLILAVTLTLVIFLAGAMSALADSPGGKPARRGGDVVEIGPELRASDKEYDALLKAAMSERGITAQAPVRSTDVYTVGSKLMWLALDEVDPMDKNFAGDIFETEYEVRAIAPDCEVWVQTDLNYYNADGTLNKLHRYAKDPLYVTQTRIDYLANLCSNSIRPIDIQYFGPYYERDGTYGLEALINAVFGTNVSEVDGQGDRLVILVSNVRDEQYYDPINNPSAIMGFNWGTFNNWGDRNFVTLDVREWHRRMGPNSDPAFAYQYEATLAHELQHLIMGDQSPNEDTWINEGMSGYAEYINGYWFTDELGGRQDWQLYPQNSVVLWNDQRNDTDHYGNELLADYQLSNAFMIYTTGRIGGNNTARLNMGKLTQESEDGILGFNKWLTDTVGSSLTFHDIFKDFRRDMLYGGNTDGPQPVNNWNGGAVLSGYTSPLKTSGGPATAAANLGRLRENLDREGYDTAGVPPFGTNFIEICWSSGLSTITFDGDEAAPPTIWEPVAASDVYAPAGSVAGDVLWSYHNDLEDNFLIYGPITVSSGDQLSFDHFYNIEDTWDYGFVQVTTDTTGLSGWTSLPLAGTKSELDSSAHEVIVANVPGFSGFSNGWLPASYNLGANYAGQTILLAFRYATDWGSAGTDDDYDPGWFIDNVRIGGTTLTTGTVNGGRSIQEVRGAGNKFDVEFLTWNGEDVNQIYPLTLNAAMQGTLNLGALGNANFDGREERGVLMISQPKDVYNDLISGGLVAAYADYSLTGLPPSICTSDVQFLGHSHEGLNRVYAGELITATVHVDNLGSSPSITPTGPSTVYVGIEDPDGTTYQSTGDGTHSSNLNSGANKFPVNQSGVLWNGSVARTKDIQTTFRANDNLPAGSLITVTVHFANNNSSTPDQYFSTQETVRVVSSLNLSTLAADDNQTSPGKVVPFTLQILNLSSLTKSVQVTASAPVSTTFASVSMEKEDLAANATQISLTQDVPPYAEAGATPVTFMWRLDDLYPQDVLTSTVTIIDVATGDTFDLSAIVAVGNGPSIYLPLITKN